VCLLVLAWEAHPRYRLIVAANRDEYHDRPSAALAPWTDASQILAGRDLRAGGTWLGVDQRRRFAVLTNYREQSGTAPAAPSRGALIPGYLLEAHSPAQYLRTLGPQADRYGGFNLLLADADSLWYASNRTAPFERRLAPGVYGLSNHRLDTPWPKLTRVRRAFEQWLAEATPADAPAGLLALLDDRRPAGLCDYPSGSRERALAAPFVEHPQFGTRCSTVLLLEPDGAIWMRERAFDRQGRPTAERDYRLGAQQWC
jgi:uncharacterized protein with NRDE domain